MRLGINKWDFEEDMFLKQCIAEYGSKPKAAQYASTKMNRTYYACLRRMYTRMPYRYNPKSNLQVVVIEPHELITIYI
jgi:hypothetical protein